MAGSAQEKNAADFIAARLVSLGYDVRIQEFPAGSELGRESRLTVVTAPQATVPALALALSGAGTVRAPLVAAGLGRPSDFAASASGAVVLIERGVSTFGEKVANAQAAGARGVIIYNNEPGTFAGQLPQRAGVPVVSTSQAEGQALLARLQSGPVQVELEVGVVSDVTSRNVIATPPGRQCETVTGGHYDSVAAGPGANDNASGTATVLEIAAVLASNGEMAANCFVLFGAEETGLIGSKAFVSSLDISSRQRLRAMLNFDMVGFGDEGWLLIGSPSLQQRASQLATNLGIPAALAQAPGSGAGSDHSSFIAAGIPAIFVHRVEDTAWHTPQDVSDRIRADLLEEAARLGVALLESLKAS